MMMMLTNVSESQAVVNLITAIVGLIAAFLSVLIPAIIFIVKAIKNKDWKQLRSIADTAMKEAEDYAKKHPAITGEDKLKMALDIRQKTLASMNIVFSDADRERAEAYINQTIKLFNSRK